MKIGIDLDDYDKKTQHNFRTVISEIKGKALKKK